MRPALDPARLQALYPDVAARFLRMPPAEKGMAVGLFGGSFNPPHAGHALVAETALKRLGLDRLWWMVTPGNPLKDRSELAPLAERLALSEAMTGDSRVEVTAFEAAFDVRYTADTLALIRAANPGVDFVWVMGADNLASFHLWQRWEEIARTFPIAVIDRPGSTEADYLAAPMAREFSAARLDEAEAQRLARTPPPAWVFLHGPRSPLSSSAIRRGGGKK